MKLYNLTLQRPGGITHVIHGNFSGPKQQEIIVSRGCVLEVLKPDPSTGKIHTLLTCNTFGIIRALHPIRLTGSNRGMINEYQFILTNLSVSIQIILLLVVIPVEFLFLNIMDKKIH
jgi:hypothetical protein